jgi:RNA polymerase sigma factor (sigma-70 family)
MTRHPDPSQRFEALLHEHRRIVFHVARLYAGHGDERHDLAQEICMQLWRAFPRYDASRSFSTWMYRIALNVGISHLRRESGRAQHFEPLDDAWAESLAGAPAPAHDERLRELEALIAQLDPLHRALVMLVLDERPHAEIAEILGISESNVSTKIHRVKQRLREQMTDAPARTLERHHGTR